MLQLQKKSFTEPTRTRSSATAKKQRVSHPHGGGGELGPPAHFPDAPSGYASGRIPNTQQTYVKRAVH